MLTLIMCRPMGSEPNEMFIQKYIDTLKLKMDGYERILSSQRYLADDVGTLSFGLTRQTNRRDTSTSPLRTYSTCRTAR
jgi:hypothetical protein